MATYIPGTGSSTSHRQLARGAAVATAVLAAAALVLAALLVSQPWDDDGSTASTRFEAARAADIVSLKLDQLDAGAARFSPPVAHAGGPAPAAGTTNPGAMGVLEAKWAILDGPSPAADDPHRTSGPTGVLEAKWAALGQ